MYDLKCPECGSENYRAERRPDGCCVCLSCNYTGSTIDWKVFSEEEESKNTTKINEIKRVLISMQNSVKRITYKDGVGLNEVSMHDKRDSTCCLYLMPLSYLEELKERVDLTLELKRLES